jgi:predicted DNA-binding mobile mystery protein A
MRNESNNPRLRQLESHLEGFRAARTLPRPERGWIHAIRSATGVSTGELGRILGTSRQLPLQFEKAEADDSITLKSLRRVADALDCELVYALVPRSATTPKPRESHSSSRANKPLRRVVARIEAAAEAPTDEAENTYFCD